MITINTSKCNKECIYGNIDDTNKSKVIVHCNFKNKNYLYGQRIPCDNKTKKRCDINEKNNKK